MAKIVFVNDDGHGQWTQVNARVQEDSGIRKSIAIFRCLKKYSDARHLSVTVLSTNFDHPITRPLETIDGFTPAQYHQIVTGLLAVYDRVYLVKTLDRNMVYPVDSLPTIVSNDSEYCIEVPSVTHGWLSLKYVSGTLQEVVDIAQSVPGISQVQFRIRYGKYLKCGVSTPDIMAFLLIHGENFVR